MLYIPDLAAEVCGYVLFQLIPLSLSLFSFCRRSIDLVVDMQPDMKFAIGIDSFQRTAPMLAGMVGFYWLVYINSVILLKGHKESPRSLCSKDW